MTYYAIIVAGGSGSRMQSKIAKQFMLLQGLPVLMHTLIAFQKSSLAPQLVVVLNESLHDQWRTLCQTHHFRLEHRVITGGGTRFHSVKNAISFIQIQPDYDGNSIVAIHDAVRPLVSKDLIERVYKEAEQYNTAIAAVQSSDSVRVLNGTDQSQPVDRNKVLLVQTPQAAKLGMLTAAYLQEFDEQFTDYESVLEKAGYPIHITAGDIRNIKITFAEDIYLAERLINPLSNHSLSSAPDNPQQDSNNGNYQ